MITKGNKSLKENLKYCRHLSKQKESNEYPQKKTVKPINSFLSFIIMCFSLLHYINCCACLLANTHCQKHRCASSFSFGSPPRVPRCLASPRAFCTCFVRLSDSLCKPRPGAHLCTMIISLNGCGHADIVPATVRLRYRKSF